MKEILKKFVPVADLLMSPFIYLGGRLLNTLRGVGLQHFPSCKNALFKAGVFPVRNHYYEPQFDFGRTEHPLFRERNLSGIDWNIEGQLKNLKNFDKAKELESVPTKKTDDLEYYFNNGAFEAGDAEFLYQLIRFKKPKRIIEVGSGNSTLMALKAIKKNEEEDPEYKCELICIEPYEMPWLEKTGAKIIRKIVEDIDLSFFSDLEEGDIFFIDSSHVIRPEGDVLYLFLQVLPSLKKGVIAHVHDIFSPRNYPDQWLVDEVRFWNEQYILEAFLTENSSWKVLGAINFLRHNHFEALKQVCPQLTEERQPGSFYIEKIS